MEDCSPRSLNGILGKPGNYLNILITNYFLDGYSGTEVVVRDLAIELKKQGHEPCVFARKLGPMSRFIVDQGVEVVSDLAALKTVPDIIHGHHHPVIVEALLRFPDIPAVSVCHDATHRLDDPVFFPRILRYVAVDNRCRRRIETAGKIPPSKIEVILNAVDLNRFRPRGPLPPKAMRALIFSNGSAQLSVVRKACSRAGLPVDVVGGVKATPNPEEILPGYDIVFAKARCALEAMAVGNAVVLCDFSGTGPIVTAENFTRLSWMNFGQGVLLNPLGSKYLESEIERYDPADAAKVTARVRSEAGIVDAARRWVELYTDVLAEFHRMKSDCRAEFHAFSDYIRKWNYESRVEWERQQLERLGEIPFLGNALVGATRRLLNWWKQRAR